MLEATFGKRFCNIVHISTSRTSFQPWWSVSQASQSKDV